MVIHGTHTVGLPSSLGFEPVRFSWRALRYAANRETDLLMQSGTHTALGEEIYRKVLDVWADAWERRQHGDGVPGGGAKAEKRA
jgi:hypothetical protein